MGMLDMVRRVAWCCCFVVAIEKGRDMVDRSKCKVEESSLMESHSLVEGSLVLK